MPSFILIHPTVWSQYTNVTDRTGQRSDSIGRTVLQTVAQKEGSNGKEAHEQIQGQIRQLFLFI